jgi:pyrimidine-nucleoside phosphorylase
LKSSLKNSGFVEQVDAASIGAAIGAIGGGRARTEDSIDHAVGFRIHAKIGDEIKSGAPLGVYTAATKSRRILLVRNCERRIK